MELTSEEAFLHLATWMREQTGVTLLYKSPDDSANASVRGTIAAADDFVEFSLQLEGDAGTLAFQTKGGTWGYAEMRSVELPEGLEYLRGRALNESPILGCVWPSGSVVTLVVLQQPKDEHD